ncbi:hypothetical protein GQ457_07G013090 [Hibiscus cannabinus]
MYGGTPVAGGSIRQRHSQGYASDNEDLEDDACSKLQPFSHATPRARTWTEILKKVLWVASALFIIHFGDRHSNFIYLLLHDGRIRRKLVEKTPTISMSKKWEMVVHLVQKPNFVFGIV